MGTNLYAPIAARVADHPDAAAIKMEGGVRLDYAGFDVLVQAAGRMLAAHGVRPGERVAGHLDKSPEAVAFAMGAMRVGAVYVPVNPGFTEGELAFLLRDAEPALIVTDLPHRLPSDTGCPVLLLGVMDEYRTGDPPPMVDPSAVGDGCAAMLYTSGTTGRPKGARMSHANMLSSFSAFNEIWQITADDHLLHVLPTYHAHGLLMATLCPLYAGARITMLPKFDIERVMELMPEVTALMAVPTVWGRIADHPQVARVGNLRLGSSGSAPLSPELYDRLLEHGLMLSDRYGSTEAGMIAANPVGRAHRGSVGRVLPGVDMRLVDGDANSVAQGEVGRIQARGPHVFLGYWRRPELEGGSRTADGWFDTGDFGKLDEEGYLFIVGRDKDMIISGGFNVYPREVELALEGIDGVAEAIVFAVPHPDFGEGVMAAVKLSDGSPDADRLLSELGRRLAAYKRPKKIVFVDEFPRNGMGKVLRNELAEAHRDALVE